MQSDQTVRRDGEQPQAGPPGLRMEGADRLSPEYANVIHATFDAYAFQLIFARVTAPAVWTSEEMDAALQHGLPTTAVSQIIVAPNALREFIDVLQGQLESFEATYGPLPVRAPMNASDPETSDGS